MSEVIHISKILNIGTDKFKNLKRNLSIEFEDGVIKHDLKYKDCIIFRYLLEAILELPKIVITSDLFISNFYDEGYYNSSSANNFYSLLFRKFVNEVIKKDNNIKLVDEFALRVYRAVNKMLLEMDSTFSGYMVGFELMDMLEVIMDEDILSQNAKINKHGSVDDINKIYENVDNVVRNKLPEDSYVKFVYLSNIVSKGQLLQMLGARGYITEIDNTIFSVPMGNNFGTGYGNMYHAIIEGSSGRKALFMSTKAIQNSEFTARELQLATMVVENIVFKDCGNNDYVDFFIRPKSDNYNGDLNAVVGKRYYDETRKEEIVITPEMKHLIGKTVKLRIVDNCKTPNKKSICMNCLGDLAYTIFPHQNIGHLSTINVTEPQTQSILSTKHLNKSIGNKKIVLSDKLLVFFLIKQDDKMFLRKQFLNRKTKSMRLHVPQWCIRNLDYIIDKKDVFNINLEKVSRLHEIVLEEVSKDGSKIDVLDVKISNRFARFTNYFFAYIIKKGYGIDENDNYVFDLSDWDYAKPIMEYERKEFDFSALGNEFKKLIKTRKYFRSGDIVRSEFRPFVLVEKLNELLNSKLTINMALLEIMVYAFTARNISEGNYDLSRNSPDRELIGIKYAIDERNLGSSLGWNKLESKIYDPSIFKPNNKVDHPLDVLFLPNEILKDRQ